MRTKTRKIKRVHQGPISGQGDTLAEAKADLKANVTVALDGSYDPAIVRHGEYTAIVFRSPTGWGYRLHNKDRPFAPDGISDVSGNCLMGNITRNKAIQYAAGHLVNLDSVDYRSDAELPEWLTDREERANVLSCRRFNRAYQWAKANKPDGRDNDHLWHEWACWHSNDEQFT